MSNLKQFLGPMRVPFLLLTPACVFLGASTALLTSGVISPLHTALALVGALSAHVSVNAFNEYFDFRSGLDYETNRTPFSGGSGTLPENPELAKQALATALTALFMTGLIGIFFLLLWGWLLLPLGILGLLTIYLYTGWLTKDPYLCLVAPGLGFGPLMVMGTNFALTGSYSWTAFTASLVPFFMVSDLLLLNQFPDVKADTQVGRRHLPIVAGTKSSSLIYGIFFLMAYLTIIFGVTFQEWPQWSLIGLATAVLAAPAFLGAYRFGKDTKKLIPYMGLNVIVVLLTPVLVGVGMLAGGPYGH